MEGFSDNTCLRAVHSCVASAPCRGTSSPRVEQQRFENQAIKFAQCSFNPTLFRLSISSGRRSSHVVRLWTEWRHGLSRLHSHWDFTCKSTTVRAWREVPDCCGSLPGGLCGCISCKEFTMSLGVLFCLGQGGKAAMVLDRTVLNQARAVTSIPSMIQYAFPA
ncbi:hypothetical protein BDP81DRAFT_429020 [Colletotrichum phormii]|uniref:Uncharacterized protein n=1 Tax=Colletotrichum phormii TaxID=359342 RepID=A0AAI9ZQ28_9PEZI|nr:uncharacterized protein BDP81DRAFT_429020 [Colletotrichum phormii]KAK1636091.1 hypothetical protein BDP81DRAFT_429020 [Colletotrichum phormii]